MEIKVLGPGCSKCKTTYQVVEKVIKENNLDEIADLTAYNKYFGWYEGKAEDLGQFLDDVHSAHMYIPVAVSEYGAGGIPADYGPAVH